MDVKNEQFYLRSWGDRIIIKIAIKFVLGILRKQLLRSFNFCIEVIILIFKLYF